MAYLKDKKRRLDLAKVWLMSGSNFYKQQEEHKTRQGIIVSSVRFLVRKGINEEDVYKLLKKYADCYEVTLTKPMITFHSKQICIENISITLEINEVWDENKEFVTSDIKSLASSGMEATEIGKFFGILLNVGQFFSTDEYNKYSDANFIKETCM